MRMFLCAIVVLLVSGGVSASEEDSIVKWRRVEGLIGGDVVPVYVGPIEGSNRWRTVGDGSVTLNLDTGYLSFRFRGLSPARPYANPLGSSATGPLKGTIVCDSTYPWWQVVWVDTEPIQLTDGNGSFEGFVSLPESCRLRPELMVFLLRHHNPGQAIDGVFVAYGAARTQGHSD